MSECYFVEEHGFGPMDKHGYHYSRTTCACGKNHKGKLDLAGKNYLYRNDKGQTVIGYHALMDDGEENPIYNKIAEIQYEIYEKYENIELASKSFYQKVGDLVHERYVKKDSRFSTIIEKFTKDNPLTCEGVAK
tara:strand:+ start:76 stop:477 length:402 start_codon:yes stop_codon:yes gene_type:complete